jgi:hypothetical protein
VTNTVVDHGTPAPSRPWGPRADGRAEVDRRPKGAEGQGWQGLAMDPRHSRRDPLIGLMAAHHHGDRGEVDLPAIGKDCSK